MTAGSRAWTADAPSAAPDGLRPSRAVEQVLSGHGQPGMLAPRSRLLEEIAKCDVVCATCHAVRTYAQQAERWAQRRADGKLVDTPRHEAKRKRSTRRRDFLLALRDRPCSDCGRRPPPCVMQFDHREARDKKFNVAESWCRSESKILEEAAKCDIVCPNCHRDRSFRRRQRTAGVAQFG